MSYQHVCANGNDEVMRTIQIVMIDRLISRSLQSYETQRQQEMPLLDYLDLCNTGPMAYASAAERMVAAIGEPQVVDTAKDVRLGRIFMNRTISLDFSQ
jgi:serine protein kinase